MQQPNKNADWTVYKTGTLVSAVDRKLNVLILHHIGKIERHIG